MSSGKSALAGVIGWPVNHSLSPRLHQFWLSKYGINGVYSAIPVDPENLADLFRKLPELGYKGWNITVPHKESAMALVDVVDENARRIGAINTVVVSSDGKLLGSNTDAFGFAENLKAQLGDLKPYLTKVVILGAGGASRAVIVALQDLGCDQIILLNRTREKAEEVARALGGVQVEDWENRDKTLAGTMLLINTTTLGMEGQSELEIDLSQLPLQAAVSDIVYRPLHTKLLRNAGGRGCRVVTGLGMLIHQARPGFAAWFGREPETVPELESYLLGEAA